jgi:drug/metabolite transporter (DMT)-like permease
MTLRTRAELYLFFITFIWGSTFVTTKYLLDGISPFLYIALRFGLASLLLLLVFSRQFRGFHPRAVKNGTILGLILAVGFALQTVGLQYTTASKSAFITGMLVVFTPICQFIIERRPPKLGNIIGVGLVMIGLYFLTSPEGSEFNVGDGLTLLCALLFAIYIVYLDIFGKLDEPAQLTLMQFVAATLFGMVASLLFEQSYFEPNLEFLAAIGYLAIFATVIAIYIQTRYQKDTTPTRSAIIFSLEPVFAAIFAYVLLGEILGTVGLLGGGLIVAGLLVSELSPA